MTRLPTLFIPHGGGPWPFVDLGNFVPRRDVEVLREYLQGLPASLPVKPRALLVISAHWEKTVPTVMTSPQPPLYFDYSGFPPEAYQIEWPAPGYPELAARVQALLEKAGLPSAADANRGYDHGTFIPLKVAWPDADIPTIQLSLKAGLDPVWHLALGRVLAPLRDEGVLILGSGMSYHDLRRFGSPSARQVSMSFDAWLQEIIPLAGADREARLIDWENAPSARLAHPREEHLLPLMVAAGAAAEDVGRVEFTGEFAQARISGMRFG